MEASVDVKAAGRDGADAPRDDRARERRLRGAFAAAGRSPADALELAAFLVAGERHDEALHVLDLACGQDGDESLRLARAGVLRDLAHNDLALVDLEEYLARRGRAAVEPGTLLELAQVAWLAGEREAAQQALRDLRRHHGASAWLATHGELVRQWSVRVETQTPTSDVGDLRDVFAQLRSAPRVADRMRLLQRLASAPRGEGRAPVRLRAIAIACADASPAVRARALQLAEENGLEELAFWATGLQDPAPLVRRFAARGLARAPGAGASDALLAALEREADAAAFRALHMALERSLAVELPLGDEHSEAARARAVEEWRKRCSER
ncbi:MAG: hypothetical protein ACON4Z_00230 [Planctomycetota bacterium]